MASRPEAEESTQPAIHMLDLKSEIAELRPELDAAIARVLDSGSFILGREVQGFEAEVQQFLGVKHAVALNSGTDALIIGLRALGIGEGDEVITSPFTFFATAESIALVGATPVFVDIEPDSFNIDPDRIEEAITPNTKAIMPIHLYGRPAHMDRLLEIADKHGLAIIEDAAQAFGATCHDLEGAPYCGTIGQVGAFSFYPTKNLGAYGDAGMLVTNDDELAELARKLRTHGSIKAYENEMVGYNSRMDELQAAILRVKLPHVKRWNEERRELAAAYGRELAGVPGIVVPEVTPGHIFHQITLRVEHGRDELLNGLRELGVFANVYYPKLASELAGFWSSIPIPTAQEAATQVLSLPILNQSESDANRTRVVSAILAAV